MSGYWEAIQPYRPKEENPRQHIGSMVACFGDQDPDVEHLLGPTGPLSESPRYRDRPQQRMLSQMVARAIKLRMHGVLEGQCGVGKSFAVIIPAVLAALKSARQGVKKPVIIATATRAQMGQYVDKDIPALHARLDGWMTDTYGRTWRTAKVGGKGTYLCLAKGQMDQGQLGFSDEDEAVQQWAATTTDGDLSYLRASQERKKALAVSERDCKGKACACYEDCYAYAARAKAFDADLIITTHSLMLHHALAPDLGILPDPLAIIIDEAHQLEGYAQGAQEVDLSAARFQQLAAAAAEVGIDGSAVVGAFSAWRAHTERVTAKNGLVRTSEIDGIATANLMAALEKVMIYLDGFEEGRQVSVREMFRAARNELDWLPTRERAGWVLNGVQEGGWQYRMTPSDVAPALKEKLFKLRPVVLTSATLTTSKDVDGFDYVKESLGVCTSLTLAVQSPFDYKRQCLLYLPPLTEGPRMVGFESAAQAKARYTAGLVSYLQELLMATGGRAFVLCTSSYAAQTLYGRLRELPFQTLLQGQYEPSEMVRRFRSTPSVLFATATYWVGIDISGPCLSCVAIDALPFTPADDPVESQRAAAMGREAFYRRTLPRAIMQMKQGFGRLIRSETDKGVLALFDPRVQTKAYGAQVLGALPPMTRILREHLPAVSEWLARPLEVA